MNHKVNKKITQSVATVISHWIADTEGDKPIHISDALALSFFVGSIVQLCKRFYRLGQKHERQKHKQKAVKRWQESRSCNG